MVHAITILLASQLAGEALSYGLNLPMPGPVIGLLILFAALWIWQQFGRVSPLTVADTPLGTTSGTLLQHLSILFVPAGVGAIDHLGLLRDYGLAIFVALLVSTALSLAVTALVFVAVKRLVARRHW
jgi:putative effector of murein hydrolase LrgA (UPF0299 family)